MTYSKIFNEETAFDRPDRLTPAEFKSALAAIERDYFDGKAGRDYPFLMYVTGLAGAGKTTYLAQPDRYRTFDVHLNFDDLRRYHPRYARHATQDPLNAAARTDLAVEQLFEAAVMLCTARKLNAVIDEAPVNVAATRRLLTGFKTAGYDIFAVVLAVPAATAAASAAARYQGELAGAQNDNSILPRHVNTAEQSAAPAILIETVDMIAREKLVNRMAVIGRGGQVFWGGHITGRENPASIVQRETERPVVTGARRDGQRLKS